MREIKFRQWSEQNKKFFYWGYVDRSFSSPTTVNGVAVPTPSEQFTGLLDKNGVEIYEGDILEHSWKPMGKAELIIKRLKVVFDNGMFTQWEVGDSDDAYAVWYPWNDIEVIGNIYENKDLLK